MSETVRRWRVSDAPLLINAVLVVAWYRIALLIIPFRKLRDQIERSALRPRPDADAMRIARAVSSAGYRIPRATCLPRALATQWLCRRHGIDTQLKLGVARSATGAFTAHAWVTENGRILIGELPDQTFSELRASA